MSNVEDDFFGDCDDCDALQSRLDGAAHLNVDQHGELSLRESAAIERQYFAIGYHETYNECYEASLQSGFDDGYRENYNMALRLGQRLGNFAIRVESSKKSRLELNRTIDTSRSAHQIAYEKKLTDVAHRVRSLLLSITQNDASRDDNSSKDEGLKNAYDGVAIDIEQPSTQAVKQKRLQQLKDFEVLTENIKNIAID